MRLLVALVATRLLLAGSAGASGRGPRDTAAAARPACHPQLTRPHPQPADAADLRRALLDTPPVKPVTEVRADRCWACSAARGPPLPPARRASKPASHPAAAPAAQFPNAFMGSLADGVLTEQQHGSSWVLKDAALAGLGQAGLAAAKVLIQPCSMAGLHFHKDANEVVFQVSGAWLAGLHWCRRAMSCRD